MPNTRSDNKSEQLADFQHIECPGRWHQSATDPGMEVVVQISNSALTLVRRNDQAIVQWSCDAFRRINPGRLPAAYSPDSTGAESLEISDPSMISVLDNVIASYAEPKIQPGLSLRGFLVFVAILAVFAVLAMLFSDRVAPQAAGLIAADEQSEIGERIFSTFAEARGGECRTAMGSESLAVLERRIFPQDNYSIRLVPDDSVRSLMLPGSIVVLGASLLESFDGPEVIAGYALAESVAAAESGPFERFLGKVGFGAAAYLALGKGIADQAITGYAGAAPVAEPVAVDESRLLEEFRRAGFSSAPFAGVSGRNGALVAKNPFPGIYRPLLTDSQWLRLRDICRD